MDAPKPVLDPDGYTPIFQIVIAVTVGVLFSPYSNGLFYLLIIALILELINAYRTGGDYYNYYNSVLRGGLFFYSLFGFILGRSFCCDDWNPLRGDFNDDDTVKKRFEEHNEKCIENMECGWCTH